MSSLPTACPSFAFKPLLYASVCPHACIFLLLDLSPEGPSISSASCPWSLQVHLHSHRHTKEVCLRRHPGRRVKNWDQIDYVCHNPSTGQEIFLLSQPLVLSPGGPATSASGYQAHDPRDKASAFLRWKTPDLQQAGAPAGPMHSCGFIKRLAEKLAGHIQEQRAETPHLSSARAKQWLQSSRFISLYLLLPTHPLSGTKQAD